MLSFHVVDSIKESSLLKNSVSFSPHEWQIKNQSWNVAIWSCLFLTRTLIRYFPAFYFLLSLSSCKWIKHIFLSKDRRIPKYRNEHKWRTSGREIKWLKKTRKRKEKRKLIYCFFTVYRPFAGCSKPKCILDCMNNYYFCEWILRENLLKNNNYFFLDRCPTI